MHCTTTRALPLFLLLSACQGAPLGVAPDADVDWDAAPSADAAPPDAAVPTLGPSLVFDDVHVAGLFEEAHAFSLLGPAVNPLLEQRIAEGTLLLGIELRDIQDPTGATDEELTAGLYYLRDTDADPTNNFDPDHPEYFTLAPGSIVAGEPVLHFTTASITARRLHAEGVGLLSLFEGFALPISNVRLDGLLTPGVDAVRLLDNGRLRGVIGVSLLSLTPNIAGEMCPGENLLDVLVTGCGFIAIQPDSDVDGDGLERLYDSDGDGAVDRCVDGDGTEILGTDCPRNPAMADGYELVFVVHGVRAILLE